MDPGSGVSTDRGRRVRRVTSGARIASEGRAAPTGRDARLWRVLVELSHRVGEPESGSSESPERTEPAPPKPFVPGQIERLVVEFDDAYTTFVEGMERLPNEAQLIALQAVDRQLTALVRAQEAELWTQKALREDPRWIEAQRLVYGVIEAFAWPVVRIALVAPGVVAEGVGAGRSSGGSRGPRSRT